MLTTSTICRRRALQLLAALSLIVFMFPAVAHAQSETIEYYGLDALGSVRAIFDQQGNVVARMDYGPFGENLRAAIKFPTEQFAQLARDSESGEDYAQARNYSAGVGRFSRSDPVYAALMQPQRWNRYAYAANNPVILVDPDGKDPFSMTGLLGAWCMYNCPMRPPAGAPGSPETPFQSDAESDLFKALWADFQNGLVSTLDVALGTAPLGAPGPGVVIQTNYTEPSPAIIVVGSVAGRTGARRSARSIAKFWTSTRKRTAVQNAFRHWMDHRSDFPELKNAVQYVKFAKNFFSNPPEGTLKFVRPGGDIMLYHPESNIFGVITAEGSIRTLYKPTDGMQYWRDQVALWGGGQE